MGIGFLRKLHLKRKEEKPYFLSKDKIFHFYGDCSAIAGRAKRISSLKSVRYSLCHVCRKRSETEVHRIATDLAAHWDSNIEELVDNVSRSGLSEDDKVSALQMGLVHMILANMTYQLLDNVGKIKSEVPDQPTLLEDGGEHGQRRSIQD